MEKNEVGCVVVCLQDNYIRICKVLPPKKGLKILRHQRLFLNLRTFLDSGLERGVCLPAKNPEKEKERAERGMECEVND